MMDGSEAEAAQYGSAWPYGSQQGDGAEGGGGGEEVQHLAQQVSSPGSLAAYVHSCCLQCTHGGTAAVLLKHAHQHSLGRQGKAIHGGQHARGTGA